MDCEAGRVGRPARPLLALLGLLIAGCTSLRSTVPLERVAAEAEPRTRYQVWSGGTPQVLISLRVSTDSVSGIPYWRSPACDSCRVALPRAAVDSIRQRGFDPNKSLLATIILTPIIVLWAAFEGMGGGGS